MSEPVPENQRRLAEAMKSLRQDRGLSVQDVAERMGKQRSAGTQVSRWERAVTAPAAHQLMTFLVAIGSSFTELDRTLNPQPATNRRLEEIAQELKAMATRHGSKRSS